jgi:hypothetical protein
MQLRTGWISLALCGAALAADKTLPIERTSNETVEITASLLDKDQILKELGSDLGGGILVLRVTVRPLTEKPVKVSRDDFLLISDRDGQRTQPFAPSQIAGNSTLVVRSGQATAGGTMGQPSGPVWGGIPGTMGRPRQGPGNGGAVGNTPGTTATEAKVDKAESKDKENPLLAVLKEKILPEKDISDPLTGLLYFPIEGKVKPKDLELHYRLQGSKLALRFKP